MILVFCETSDLPALWAAGRLRARGLAVDIVTAPVLDCALKWRHAISAGGDAQVAIELADGRRISSDQPAGVLNRLNYAPRGRLEAVGGEGADFAPPAMDAFFLPCLVALP